MNAMTPSNKETPSADKLSGAEPANQPKIAKPPKPLKRPAANRNDQEFLPAALEILETPPSPVRMALLFLICLFVSLTLLWSWIGTIDIFATASGKIQPTGRVKIVQPLETGRVATLNVKNGSLVKEGDIVITQVSDEAVTDRAAVSSSLKSSKAEVLRRKRSIQMLTTLAPEELSDKPLPVLLDRIKIDWPNEIPQNIRDREDLVLTNMTIQLHAALAGLNAQKAQKQAELTRLSETAKAESKLIDSLNERTAMKEKMVDAAAGSRATMLETRATLQTQEAVLATELGQIEEAKAGVLVLDAEIAKIRSSALADDTLKILEAERKVDELEKQLERADEKLAHMTLKAPITGTVQSLSVTTIGQVVTSGEELMRIIPEGSTLEVTAYLENKDIGFIHEGQDAIIKIESFPFTRYGTIQGKVIHVGRDSVPAADAMRSEGDPTLAPNAQSTFQPSQPTQNLVYPVTIIPDKTFIHADGVDVPLAPGMTVSAEIRTGTRRILEYIVSPLVEVTSKAMTER